MGIIVVFSKFSDNEFDGTIFSLEYTNPKQWKKIIEEFSKLYTENMIKIIKDFFNIGGSYISFLKLLKSIKKPDYIDIDTFIVKMEVLGITESDKIATNYFVVFRWEDIGMDRFSDKVIIQSSNDEASLIAGRAVGELLYGERYYIDRDEELKETYGFLSITIPEQITIRVVPEYGNQRLIVKGDWENVKKNIEKWKLPFDYYVDETDYRFKAMECTFYFPHMHFEFNGKENVYNKMYIHPETGRINFIKRVFENKIKIHRFKEVPYFLTYMI